jgi:hypothetical protein
LYRFLEIIELLKSLKSDSMSISTKCLFPSNPNAILVLKLISKLNRFTIPLNPSNSCLTLLNNKYYSNLEVLSQLLADIVTSSSLIYWIVKEFPEGRDIIVYPSFLVTVKSFLITS